MPRPIAVIGQVVEALDESAPNCGRSKSLRVDNGPGFAGRMLDQWAYLNQAEIDFSRAGTPTDNAYIEAFNSRLRAECLMVFVYSRCQGADRAVEERLQ